MEGWHLFRMAAAVLLSTAAAAQSSGTRDPGPGKFLIARQDLLDPNFVSSVVLLVHSDGEKAMGLIINRRTKAPLSRVFAELKEAKNRTDPVYLGGPVARTGAVALLRAAAKPDDARHVFAGIYMVSDKALLEKTMAAGTESSAFRVYLGYAGWTARQLRQEIEAGAWYVRAGEAAMVFDPEPDSLWSRLVRELELRLARLLLRPRPVALN